MNTINKIPGVGRMKKFFLLFTLMLLVFNYSYSVSKIMPETDWKKMNLKGRVMKMVKKVRKYNIDGKSLGEEEVTFIFNSQGYITTEIHGGAFSLSYKYDENGYLIRSVDVYGIEHEYEYEYDENGYLVQTDRERKKRSFANMKKNFYNKYGKLAKSQLFTQSEYSKKGIKLSSSAKYEKDKKKGLFELLSEETYVYDKNGKLLRIDDTKASANREYIVITFENFKDGKYVKTVEVNGIQAFKTCYDKDGNEIEWAWITYSPEEQIQSFILYSGIKKDKYGNLIEKTGKYLEITDGGKKLGKETGVIAEEMKIEYKYYE